MAKKEVKEIKETKDLKVAKEARDSKEPKEAEMVEHQFLTREELEKFRRLLIEERDKMLTKAEQMVKAGNIELDKNEMSDEVDLASVTTEQNLTFKLMDRDRKLLNEIDHALSKIDTGEYGFCEGTGEMIPKRRLEVRPWCRHSVKYKEQLEKMKKSGRGVGDEEEF